MGIFSRLFGSKRKGEELQPAQKQVVLVVQRLVDIINESLDLAANSKNPDTKLSRLDLAKQNLQELEVLTQNHPYIKLKKLSDVKNDIAKIENDFLLSGLQAIVSGNQKGDSLEKTGDINGAILEYEKLLNRRTDTPFTYRRLAILYRKLKRREDEVRAIKVALKNVPKKNAKHYKWFVERLNKLTG